MIPLSLCLKNFFSHKESFIDFENFNSALLIGNIDGDYSKSNGAGKTAILEGILWALFNKARVAAIDDIILWGESICSVEFKFNHNGQVYLLKRNRNRVNGTSNVEFYLLLEDGNYIDISGSTSKLTNDKIISVLKFDYKTFINSAYFRQNDISEFALADPSRKKEILKSIIDISKWDDYEKEVKIKLKTLKQESEILKANIENLEKLEVELSIQNNRIKDEEGLRVIILKEKNILKETCEDLYSRYQSIKNNLDTNTWDRIIEQNKILEKDILSLNKNISILDENISKIESKISSYKNEKDSLLLKNKEIDTNKDLSEPIATLEEELIKYKSKFETSKIMFNKLKDEEIQEGVCNVCGQDIAEHISSSLKEKKMNSLNEYRKEGVYSKNKISEIEANLKDLVSEKNSIERAKLDLMKISSINDNLLSLNQNLAEKKSNLSKANDSVSEKQTELYNNIKILDSIKNDDFQKIHKELIDIRGNIESKENKIGDINKSLGSLSEKVKNLNDKISELKKDRDTLFSMSVKINIYEKMIKLFGKNGIQVILLNAIIEDLEQTANKILSDICNESISIALETQRLGSDGHSVIDTLDLKVQKDGMAQNFKSLSGGEQFRISLALRIALSEISSRHGGSLLEFLLLDEINSPLDKDGTESLFVNVISTLEKKYKILVITHDDYLKERFLNIIDVTKVNGESSVSFYQK
jgi:exonuclease SbcC